MKIEHWNFIYIESTWKYQARKLETNTSGDKDLSLIMFQRWLMHYKMQKILMYILHIKSMMRKAFFIVTWDFIFFRLSFVLFSMNVFVFNF